MISIAEELLQIRGQLTLLFDVVENLILRLQELPEESDSDSDSDSSESGYNSSSHSSEHERFLPPPNSLEPIDLLPASDSGGMAIPPLVRERGRYIRDQGIEYHNFH